MSQKDERIPRLRRILIGLLALLAVDVCVFVLVVPWAGRIENPLNLSLDYILGFLTILVSFLLLFPLLAYFLRDESPEQ